MEKDKTHEKEIDTLLSILDLAYFEISLVFEGLANDNVWKRPAERLLSIGEIAGHVAYWEAVRLTGEDDEHPDKTITKCHVESPLIDQRFRYYPVTLGASPSDRHLAMSAEDVCKELLRVHQESVAHFKVMKPDLHSLAPGHPQNFTYYEYLKYATFHVSYHTGQMYTARFLLGENPPDN